MQGLKGELPGFSFEVTGPSKAGACILCGKGSIPLLCRAAPEGSPEDAAETWKGICEFCARSASWLWARVRSETPEAAPLGAPSSARSCRVLVLRTVDFDEAVKTMTDPRQAEAVDALVVPKEAYSLQPTAKKKTRWELPGGDVELEEDPRDAAVRLLAETSGAKTWPHAIEPLWFGLDERGRTCHVFLARGFYLPGSRYECAKGHVTSSVAIDDVIECGAAVGGRRCPAMARRKLTADSRQPTAEWKPIGDVFGELLAAPLGGVELALSLRKRSVAHESNLPNVLSVRMRAGANELIALGLGRLVGEMPPGDLTSDERDERMVTLRASITAEEKLIVDAIIGQQDEIDRMAQAHTVQEADSQQPTADDVEELDEGTPDGEDDEGFVRPAGPSLNTRLP